MNKERLTEIQPGFLSAKRRARNAARVLGCACLLLALPLSLLGLDPAKSVFQFNVQNWSRQNGLPTDKINTVVQTADGYIWLGTQRGLIRFDGVEFKEVPANFPNAQGEEVAQLVRSKSGGVRIAIDQGRFGSYDGRSFSAIDNDAWPRKDILGKTILQARDGAVWTGSSLGLGRWILGDPKGGYWNDTAIHIRALCEDAAGRIWIGTDDRGLLRYADGKVTQMPDPLPQEGVIRALAADGEGRIWLGTGTGVRCYDVQGQRLQIPSFTFGVSTLLVDSHGILWLGTGEAGLARYQDGAFTFLRKADGLGSNHVTALAEDAEGSLWVGTWDGLTQITDLKFPIYSERDGIGSGTPHSVAASRLGGLWVASTSGSRYFGGTAEQRPSHPALLGGTYLKQVFEARNGDVLLVDAARNISVFSDGKLAAHYPNDHYPEALAEDAESVLVGVGDTLCRIQDGAIRPYRFNEGKQPDFGYFDNLTVARDGAIWASTFNGIFRVKDGGFQRWSDANGLSGNRAHFILEDIDGSIWAGLATGMARISGNQIKNIRVTDGLPADEIYAIVPDDLGFFWIASGRGIVRVARQSLNDFAEGKSPRIQSELFDGLESIKFNDRTEQGFSGCRTQDGRIWFPNPKGVVMIDPANFFANKVPPPVLIEQVVADGKELKEQQSAVLGVGLKQVEFFFAALSYIAPQKVHVQYQLEGLDPTWLDAGARRSALYNNLKPGRYAFHVRARNADGVMSTADNDFRIELPPHYYQTAWFFVLCGLTVALALVGGYRWKVRLMELRQRKLQAENDLLEAKVTKRTDELADSVSLLKATIDSTADGILAIQFSGKVVSFNSQYESMWGFHPKALENGRDEDMINFTAKLVKDPGNYITRIKEIHANPEVDAFDVLELTDGRTIERYCKPQRVGGKCVGIVINFRDITARKHAEFQLRKANQQLLETSRHAGRAEVASSVLHNIGNVLNSVNVSATIAADRMRGSKLSSIAKIATLLEEQAGDLGAFLAHDDRGKKIPAYLAVLGADLAAEQKDVIGELDDLRKNIEHIKDVVAMQQSFSKISGVVEDVALVELIEDVIRIDSDSLRRHGIQIIRDFGVRPVLYLERHKVMQILVNLIRNARHACGESGRSERTITLRITEDDKFVQVAVIDNGVGIPKGNLTRIFAHGFTTKKDGHGFGLHSGALTARELGGSLNVQSDGLGQGAAFILVLPRHPRAKDA